MARAVKLPFNLPRPPAAPLTPPTRAALALLFGTIALALAPHLVRQPLWLAAATTALVLWRLVLLARDRPVPHVALRAVLSVAMVVLVVTQYQTIFGRTAGSAMLVCFTGLKVLETQSLRDAMFANILAAVVVLAGFLFDQSPATAAWGLACGLLVIANFNMLTAPHRAGARRTFALTARILAWALPITLVAYVLFPRIEGSLWGIADEPATAVSGLTDRIEHGSVTELLLNEEVAFRADFEGIPPPREELYWRALVLDRFDGRTWTASGRTPGVDALDPGDASAIVSYSVILEASRRRWLPVLELAVSVSPPNRLDHDALALAPRPPGERYRYQARSAPARYLDTLPAGEPARAYPGAGDEVMRLAADLDAGNAEDTATAILAMFREQPYYYTLSPPATGADPVRGFLFETRRGYCEHFAGAFAALMRAAGYPARLVVGYQGGEYNPAGDYYIVRQYDAHAWTEIHVEGRGWMRIDPTAAVAPERIELGLDALRRLESAGALDGDLSADGLRAALELDWLDARFRQMSLWADAATHQWNTWVLGYGREQQQLLLGRLGVAAPDWTWMVLALAASLSAVVLVIHLALALPGREPEMPGRYFAMFRRKLTRAGLTAPASEGPRDLAERAAQRFPDAAADIRAIGAEYTALAYAPAGRASLAVLRRRVRRLKLGR